MPYTIDTRIKHVSRHAIDEPAKCYPQVLYRYPFTKFTRWVDMENSYNYVGKEPLVFVSYLHVYDMSPDVDRYTVQFAKAVIAEYRKRFNSQTTKAVIQYSIYP